MATQPQYRHSSGNGHDHRNPREIEHEIEQTRSQMDQTIDELSERLNPRHLMDMAYDYFRSSTPSVSRSDMARSAKQVSKTVGKTLLHEIQEHPIPALLIGAGIAYALFVEEDEDEGRDFHSQWADIPEYSGSFVDARTGEPYDLESYGKGWKQEAAAWHPGYDWSRSDVNEETWAQRAKESLDDIRTTLGHANKSAYEKLKHVSTRVLGLSGHNRRDVQSRWANLRSHGGSWMDLQSGQPYDQEYGRQWESIAACDYCATTDWTPEEQQTWSEKAQHALEEMQQSLADSGRSAKEQVQALASKVGELMGSTRDMSSKFGHSLSDRAGAMYGRAGEASRQMGRGMSRGARRVGRQARERGSQMQHQLRQGFTQGRDTVSETMDEYPLAAGAAVLGLGLLLGLALPRTRYEDEMMGETSDEFKHRAKETGLEAAERAKHVAQATAAAAMDEAEQQGLSAEQLGEKVQHAADSLKESVHTQSGASPVSTLAEKVGHIAERAATTAKEEAKKEAKDMQS